MTEPLLKVEDQSVVFRTEGQTVPTVERGSRRTSPVLGVLCAALLAGIAAPAAAHAGDLGTLLSADRSRAIAEGAVSACAADRACTAATTSMDDAPEDADPSLLQGDDTGHVVWDDGRTSVRVGARTRVDFSAVR